MKKINSINFHYITDSFFSGYGMATRNMLDSFKEIKSLNVTECKAAVKSRTFTTDFFIRPPGWFSERSKKRIGYFYWECDKLPLPWAQSLTTADEIWAPCELVRRVCLESGFRGSIKIVPTPHRPWNINFSGRINLPEISDNSFKFYSIFQWHTRKGWKELLTGYLTEFKKDDDVILILKVNSIHGPAGNKEIIDDINSLKRSLGLSFYPRLFLMDSFIPYEQIQALHEYADCYVSPHHGEGWGMPIHDAIFAQKHLIVTKYGGVTEFLDNNSANIIEHKMGPVTNMEWNPAYNPNQNWAYPSVEHLKFLMRDVYSNHNEQRLKSKPFMLEDLALKTSISGVSQQIATIMNY